MKEIVELDIDLIDPSPWQPRYKLTGLPELKVPEDLKLALLVRPRPGGRYELIDGEGRISRLKEIGATKARCEIRSMDDKEAAVSAYTINSDRGSYDEWEQGRWLARFMKAFGATQAEAAEAAHINQGTVSRLIGLAKERGELPSDYGTTISESANKPLTTNKLKIIGSLPREQRAAVIKVVGESNVSTSDTKAVVAKVRGGKDPVTAVTETENWKASHKQEEHQDGRRAAGKKAPPKREYVLCSACGDRPYYIHTGPRRHEFYEEGEEA